VIRYINIFATAIPALKTIPVEGFQNIFNLYLFVNEN